MQSLPAKILPFQAEAFERRRRQGVAETTRPEPARQRQPATWWTPQRCTAAVFGVALLMWAGAAALVRVLIWGF